MDEREKTEPVQPRTGTRVAGLGIKDGLLAIYSPSLWPCHAVSVLQNVPEMPVPLAPEHGIIGLFKVFSSRNLRAWLCTSKPGL